MRAYMLDGNKVFNTDKGEFLSYIEPYIGAETNVKPINNILLVDVIWTFKYYLKQKPTFIP